MLAVVANVVVWRVGGYSHSTSLVATAGPLGKAFNLIASEKLDRDLDA